MNKEATEHKEEHAVEQNSTSQEDMSTEHDESLNTKTESESEEKSTSEENSASSNHADKVKAELTELNDRYVRLYSEFENFRRRTAKEKLDLIANAGEGVYKEILPVLDDLTRAVKNNEKAEDLNSVKEGVKLIQQKFQSLLAAKGVLRLEAEGSKFDPDMHEALTKIPAPTEDLKGKVVDVIENGYTLNGKVIRFAKVVVGE